MLLVVLVAALVAGCSSSTSAGHGSTSNVANTSSPSSKAASTPSKSASSSSSVPAGPTTTVNVSSLLSDGGTYGVGMPIVLYFKPAPKNVKAFEAAVKVTVNAATLTM
ncbi:MAG: hypothetical protein J0H43_08600, partial [Actinobacteria bacterium]|nr:hypothetical protein [Actinomycetota bacterium]